MTAKRTNLVYVVEAQKNPSTDFFIMPRFNQPNQQINLYSLQNTPDDLSEGGKISIVFVRYLNGLWKEWVERNRALIETIYYFMDDDLFDLTASEGLSLRYRWKLAWFARRHLSWLRHHWCHFLVSTPYLQDKYWHLHPELVLPQASYPQLASMVNQSPIVAFYHGSGSHQQEAKWLYPVLEAALVAEPRLQVEMVGDEVIHRYYKSLARVVVVHQMSWQTYQVFLLQKQRHIGLAPVLPSRFNSARSCTKFFDITQAGAMGIYTQGTDCERYIVHQENGLLLPIEEEQWIAGIKQLSK